MANSSLVNYTKLTNNYSSRNGNKIDKITIHHMAGNLTVEQCGEVFQNREASANYGIGTDGRVGLYVEEKNRAWATANPANDRRAINIELANDGGAPDWHVSDTAINKCIELCVDICKRNGINKLNYTGDTDGNLTRHNMFVNTTCPGPYLQSKYQYIADEVNKQLNGSEPTPEGNVAYIQRTLNERYGYNVAIDNIYGPDTHKHMVMALQTEFNTQLGTRLAIDGIFGSATKRACPVLSIGMSGNITWLVQSMLVIKGYSVGSYGIDSIYGNDTANSVGYYQSKNDLFPDKLCGPNTFQSLFK